MRSFYRSQHDFVFVFRHGDQQNRNNFLLGKFDRSRADVWEYPSINSIPRENQAGHPDAEKTAGSCSA